MNCRLCAVGKELMTMARQFVKRDEKVDRRALPQPSRGLKLQSIDRMLAAVTGHFTGGLSNGAGACLYRLAMHLRQLPASGWNWRKAMEKASALQPMHRRNSAAGHSPVLSPSQ